ncbi:hypothetical protein C8R47DRAFT_1154957 [Mycena vitilis]|nr:hypothetical protein C8R47DRAFT_1154957 [Mycena vitilis]
MMVRLSTAPGTLDARLAGSLNVPSSRCLFEDLGLAWRPSLGLVTYDEQDFMNHIPSSNRRRLYLLPLEVRLVRVILFHSPPLQSRHTIPLIFGGEAKTVSGVHPRATTDLVEIPSMNLEIGAVREHGGGLGRRDCPVLVQRPQFYSGRHPDPQSGMIIAGKTTQRSRVQISPRRSRNCVSTFRLTLPEKIVASTKRPSRLPV